MRNFNRILSMLFCVLFILMSLPVSAQSGENTIAADETGQPPAAETPELPIADIENYIQKQMEKAKFPGLAVVIVSGDTVYKKGFGFADVEKQKPVTDETLFELASCSKAFTGLAIHKLVQSGALGLDEPVEKYIPWLKLNYEGKPVPVTINQFQQHSGGLPTGTIGLIPPSDEDNALEEAIRSLIGIELEFQPGSRFLYTSTNYDVLGLLIQTASGQSFEDYIKSAILTPAGMTGTVLKSSEAKENIAAGYKISFQSVQRYDAPFYRGNTPGGYVMSNMNDMEKWLKIQMGLTVVPELNQSVIAETHSPGSNGNLFTGDAFYSAGWFVYRYDNYIKHSGNNPTFSSFVGFLPEKKLGVVVLSNINSNFTDGTGSGLISLLSDRHDNQPMQDMNIYFDSVASKALYIASAVCLLFLFILVRTLQGIFNKKRGSVKRGFGWYILVVLLSVLSGGLVFLLYRLPSFFNYDVPWSVVSVWMPASFPLAVLALVLAVIFFYFFSMAKIFFPKVKTGI